MSGVGIAGAFGKAAAPAALGLLRSYGKKKYDELIATYTNTLDQFLDSSKSKCGHIKTLLNGEEAIPLERLYVETRFHNGNGSYTDKNLLSRFKMETGAFVISGFAGSGKSMFMRYAAHTLINEMLHHQRVPLFVEVRDMRHADDDALEKMIFEYCSSSDNSVNYDQFKVGLREGLFIIMLDGVDETPIDQLDAFLKKIQKFSQQYRQCVVVASVRPGTQLTNITAFKRFNVSSMKLEQVIEVVEKAPLEERRKTLFTKALKDGLYEKQDGFLSNPLLVTIVLITFDDASRVPDHLIGFYAAAFDALFGRHDWSKGVYVRTHKTKLEKSDFEKAFTHFCYVSYFRGAHIFDKDDVIALFKDALKYAKVNVSAYDYLHDCILAVCLLQSDEPKVTFVHRSFQEYFTAKFVSHYSGPKLNAMLDWLANRSYSDHAFAMTAQLNRESVIRAWGLSKIKAFLDEAQKMENDGNYVGIIEKAGIDGILIEFRSGDVVGMGVGSKEYAIYDSMTSLAYEAEVENNTMISGNLYPDGKFGSLSAGMQNKMRLLNKSGGETLFIDDSNWKVLYDLNLQGPATSIIKHANFAKSEMEKLILEQDELASIVDVPVD